MASTSGAFSGAVIKAIDYELAAINNEIKLRGEQIQENTRQQQELNNQLVALSQEVGVPVQVQELQMSIERRAKTTFIL